MQWRDNDKQVARDYAAILGRSAHVVGLTEVYADLDLLRSAAKRADYRVFFDTRTGKAETVVAVRDDLKVLRDGGQLVNPAEAGKPPAGGHSARYATWVDFEFGTDEVFFVEGHWVTGQTASRTAKRRAMSDVVAKLVREEARGSALAFWGGDTNADDRQNNDGSVVYEPLEAAGLVSCWDEARAWPPTHIGKNKSTIDLIGSFRGDSRVRLHQAKRWPLGESDHFQVSAFYDIAERAEPPSEPPSTEPAVERVHAAWTVTGPSPEAHRAAQEALRQSWPTLGAALDALAAERVH